MIVRKEMDLDEVLDEISSEIADKFVEMFGGYAEGVLEDWLYDEELDYAASRIEANEMQILKEIVDAMDRPLTRKELAELEDASINISGYDCEVEGIEVEPPLVDEDGREFEMVEEDRRQMTLWPEEGMPPMRLRRYPMEFPISGRVAGACAAPELSLAVLSPSVARVGSSEEA